MSRVDEALRALERDAAPGAAVAAPEPGGRLTLAQYPNETGRPGAAVLKPPSTDVPRVQPAPKGGSADSKNRLIDRHTPGVQVEQYRRLAAALHDAQVERGVKTVMVTSAMPREGKTLTALNLARTLSDSYRRNVLLVDADLRWPSIHDVLGIQNVPGLSEALREETVRPRLVEMSPGWTVLTAGHPGPSPLAGLTSERMGTLLDDFESAFDWVLLDTPPVGFLPDARLLARVIRSVVLVIAANATPAHAVARAVEELGAECVLGTVLNRIDDDEIPDAGYYYGGGRSSVRVS